MIFPGLSQLLPCPSKTISVNSWNSGLTSGTSVANNGSSNSAFSSEETGISHEAQPNNSGR